MTVYKTRVLRIGGVPENTILGRRSTGAGVAESLTPAQLRDLCALYSQSQIDTALAGKVNTSDSRLSDARTPTNHQHSQSDISGLVADLAAKVDTASAVDQVFSGTITWTGTTAPSGTATTRFSWVRVGKLVFFEFRFSWTVAGSSLTAAQWDLPAGFPAPATMTGQDAGEIYSFVSGGAGAAVLGGVVSGSILEARLQLDGSNNPQVRLRFSTGVGAMNASGVYRCA